MNPPKNLLIHSLNYSVYIQWNYNMTNDTVHFNVYCTNDTVDTVHFNIYCTTITLQQQRTRYSKTVLYNDNNTFNTSITGLLPNTTYTCCVLAVTSYGESKVVCQNVTSKCTVYNYVIYVEQSKII